MRALVAILVCGLAAPAAAGPKSLPPKLAKAADAAFKAAQAADAKGDLQTAWKQYERAIEIAPHPSTYFNLADVQARAKVPSSAIRSYEKYLELAHEAADRKAVEKRILELREIKGTLDFEIAEPDALLFIDGKPAGKLPEAKLRKVMLRERAYEIDVITPITHGHGTCQVHAHQTASCNVPIRPRTDGNVVLGTNMTGRSWDVDDDQRFQMPGRFPARPGTYQLKLRDSQCAPLTLVVPAGDVVTYAFITAPDPAPDTPACSDLKIEQRRVKFD
jgi:hypothetical protein